MFEKLEVYQKAVDLAAEISEITETFPKGNYYLSDQLNRAALSIPTNIAEGNGRWHKPA
jgi:four helix bundle protein